MLLILILICHRLLKQLCLTSELGQSLLYYAHNYSVYVNE
jgi:hypothetical protein